MVHRTSKLFCCIFNIHPLYFNSSVVFSTSVRCIFTIRPLYFHLHFRKIFEHYYPYVFDNWYLDDWISLVYVPTGQATVVKGWQVIHHTSQYGQRYAEARHQEGLVKPEVAKGQARVKAWLHDTLHF
jgi:hypothetical protein